MTNEDRVLALTPEQRQVEGFLPYPCSWCDKPIRKDDWHHHVAYGHVHKPCFTKIQKLYTKGSP